MIIEPFRHDSAENWGNGRERKQQIMEPLYARQLSLSAIRGGAEACRSIQEWAVSRWQALIISRFWNRPASPPKMIQLLTYLPAASFRSVVCVSVSVYLDWDNLQWENEVESRLLLSSGECLEAAMWTLWKHFTQLLSSMSLQWGLHWVFNAILCRITSFL